MFLTAMNPPIQRSNGIPIDGMGIISRPATRRIRQISLCSKNNDDKVTCMVYGSPVYVGPDPVLKKSKNDLRRRPMKKKEAKVLPKRASKTCLQPWTRKSSRTKMNISSRNRRGSLTKISDTPKVPCRKPSNHFLREGFEAHGDLNPGRSYNITTRSRSRLIMASNVMDSHPRAPSRKESIPSNLQTTASDEAPGIPQRKASNPFLQGGLVSHHGPMTRSRSKLQFRHSLRSPKAPTPKDSIPEFQMAEAPSLPQHKGVAHGGTMTRSRSKLQIRHSLGLNNVPIPNESIPEFQLTQAPWMPHPCKASNPFLRGGLVIERSVPCPATQGLQKYLQAAPQARNSNKNKIQPSLGVCKTVSVRDLEFDKLSLNPSVSISQVNRGPASA
ncbi:expressed unknown protein [Seminavis robusta]|uniref:Uncharacterized protein n=1 Tax=Seminavis robusta TaxID=568900 RepID=A0A9N8HA10_9STRA|nr:expressed unknown protein [Seminavis robusta]|eukprot:Sro210_g087510.1 n/a (386) ;mRNA; f:9226-10383